MTRSDDFYGPVAALFAIDPDGSDLIQLTDGESAFPTWSPDGSRLAVTIRQGDGSWQIVLMAADGSNAAALTSGPGVHEAASWAPDGSWIAFDYSPNVGGAAFHTVLHRIDVDGENEALLGNADTFDVEPRISPDGTKVVFIRLSAGGEPGTIVVRDIATGDERELEAAGTSLEHPSWSPDGAWIIYNSTDGNLLSRISSDGTGEPIVILDRTASPTAFKAAYSPDGSRIVFGCQGPGGGDAMCLVNADGSGLMLFADAPGNENYFSWGVAAP